MVSFETITSDYIRVLAINKLTKAMVRGNSNRGIFVKASCEPFPSFLIRGFKRGIFADENLVRSFCITLRTQ